MEVVNTRAALRLSHGLTFHTPAAAPRARNAVANTVTQIRDHTRARASASSAPAISRGTPADRRRQVTQTRDHTRSRAAPPRAAHRQSGVDRSAHQHMARDLCQPPRVREHVVLAALGARTDAAPNWVCGGGKDGCRRCLRGRQGTVAAKAKANRIYLA
jgi:hypothetical protein